MIGWLLRLFLGDDESPGFEQPELGESRLLPDVRVNIPMPDCVAVDYQHIRLGRHVFSLQRGEIIKIGEVPYRYRGNGILQGGTDPALARRMRDNG
jgi:hypothetical protein